MNSLLVSGCWLFVVADSFPVIAMNVACGVKKQSARYEETSHLAPGSLFLTPDSWLLTLLTCASSS